MLFIADAAHLIIFMAEEAEDTANDEDPSSDNQMILNITASEITSTDFVKASTMPVQYVFSQKYLSNYSPHKKIIYIFEISEQKLSKIDEQKKLCYDENKKIIVTLDIKYKMFTFCFFSSQVVHFLLAWHPVARVENIENVTPN